MLLLLALSLKWILVLSTEEIYTNCGGRFNETTGVIQTPNFPHIYPVPIFCRWIIEAPPGKIIMFYMTQFYLKFGLTATEYTVYGDSRSRKDHGDLGFNSTGHDDSKVYFGFATDLRTLVLELNLRELANTNWRVGDYFLDTYGVNATYEMVDADVTKPRNACSVFYCKFNGNCLASADFQTFGCVCFPGFYGNRCQYGPPHCDPLKGKNPCLNDGQCRLTAGHLASACDCLQGYYGPICEHRNETFRPPVPTPSVPSHCKIILDCSYQCDPSLVRCVCPPGSRLQSDNKTCAVTDLKRYEFRIKLKDLSFDPAFAVSPELQAQKEKLKKKLEKEIQNLLIVLKRLPNLQNITVIAFKPGAMVHFHFFGSSSDMKLAKEALIDFNKRGKIGNFSVDGSSMGFELESALKIQSVLVKGSPDGKAIVAGGSLQLACISLGSSDIKFSWLKDGSPIDTSLSTNLWLDRVPKNTNEEHTGILHIKDVSVIDSGDFTCVVRDWGQVQSSSVRVAVVGSPSITVMPLTVTVYKGDTLALTCTSVDDRSGNFTYSWSKNDESLKSEDGVEIFEQLYPTGSRAKIFSARQYSNYTCTVSTASGKNSASSIVNVIDSGYPTCAASDLQDLMWGRSAVNTVYRQPCPREFYGIVTRQCKRVGDDPAWEPPDFGNCMSVQLDEVYQRFLLLERGYQITSLNNILAAIKETIGHRFAFYPNEGRAIVQFLTSLINYDKKRLARSAFEAIAVNKTRFDLEPKRSRTALSSGPDDHKLVDIVALVLRLPNSVTESKIVNDLLDVNRNYGLLVCEYIEAGQSLKIDRDSISFDLKRVAYKDGSNTFDFPRRAVKSGQPTWFTDNVEVHWDVDLPPRQGSDPLMAYNKAELALITYRNLSALLQKRSLAKIDDYYEVEYELNSKIVTVDAKRTDGKAVDAPLFGSFSVDIVFTQINSESLMELKWNLSCAMANFSARKLNWIPNACSLATVDNLTHCHCESLGIYALLLTSYVTQKAEAVPMEFDLVITLGCGTCLCFIFLTLILLVLCRRSMSASFMVLKLQLCFGIAGAMATFISQACAKPTDVMYPWFSTLLAFFLLLPLSTQICCEMLIYIHLARMYHIKNALTKLIILSWGIPTFVTSAAFIAQSVEGFATPRWWLQFAENGHSVYMYSFSISAVILFVLYVGFYLVVSAGLRRVEMTTTKEEKSQRYKRRFICRSLIFEIVFVSMLVCCCFYANNLGSERCKLAFSLSCGVLGFTVCLLFALKPETFCCPGNDDNANTKENKKSPKHLLFNGSPDNMKEYLSKQYSQKPDIMSNHKGNHTANHITQAISALCSPKKSTNQNNQSSYKAQKFNHLHQHHRGKKCHASTRPTGARKELEDLIQPTNSNTASNHIQPCGDTQETYISMGGDLDLGLDAPYNMSQDEDMSPNTKKFTLTVRSRDYSDSKRQDYHFMKKPNKLNIVTYEESPKKLSMSLLQSALEVQNVIPEEERLVKAPARARCFIRTSSSDEVSVPSHLGGNSRVSFDEGTAQLYQAQLSSSGFDSDEDEPLPPPPKYMPKVGFQNSCLVQDASYELDTIV